MVEIPWILRGLEKAKRRVRELRIYTDFSLNSERRSLTTDYTDGTDEEETCKNIREIRVIRG